MLAAAASTTTIFTLHSSLWCRTQLASRSDLLIVCLFFISTAFWLFPRHFDHLHFHPKNQCPPFPGLQTPSRAAKTPGFWPCMTPPPPRWSFLTRHSSKLSTEQQQIDALCVPQVVDFYKQEAPGILYVGARVLTCDIDDWRAQTLDADTLLDNLDIKFGHTKSWKNRERGYRRCDRGGRQKHFWLWSYKAEKRCVGGESFFCFCFLFFAFLIQELPFFRTCGTSQVRRLRRGTRRTTLSWNRVQHHPPRILVEGRGGGVLWGGRHRHARLDVSRTDEREQVSLLSFQLLAANCSQGLLPRARRF